MVENCCCSSSCCGAALVCPICNNLGQSVPFETVKSMVRVNIPAEGEFGVCLTADCDVVYFSSDAIFRQADVEVPIAWKKGANPKYVCYCNQVTEEEIVRAVVENKAKTVGDVAKATGAMKNGKCLINNPKGACCHKDIENVIQQALESK